MKKLSIFVLLSLIFSSAIFANQVNENELKNAGNETIEFINYTGPHKVIETIEAIKGIGSDLGSKITKESFSDVGNKNKYYVIHAVDPAEKGKLDADILYLGKNAGVDHIKNLRRIISAYLSSAYGYSEKDADTLAVFITVYNAVYRGNLDIYKSKYKDVVTKNLSAENCGLSVTYKDWPGKSEIVIPLNDVNGGLSTVDTSVISDSKVVDSMQEDDDKNVQSRKDMVDIKEREAENATEKAQESQKKAVEEQKKLEEEKQKTQEVKKEAEEAQKKAEENPDDEQAQQEAEEKQQAVKEQEQKQEEQQAKTDEAKQEAAEQQAIADKKQTEAQTERKEIAQDQQEIQQKEAENARVPSEFGIILSDEEKLLSRLVKFNTQNGEIIKSSPVSVIRNRTIYENGENYIAIAGETEGNATVKLVLIDNVNMEIVKESQETKQEETTVNDEVEKVNPAKVGEYVEGDVWRISLLDAKQYNSIDDEYYSEKPEVEGNKFVVLFFEVENISNTDDYFNMFYIESYIDGYSSSTKYLINKPENYESLTGDVAAGRKLKGYVAYEVDPNWQKIEFSYKNWVGTSGKVATFLVTPDMITE